VVLHGGADKHETGWVKRKTRVRVPAWRDSVFFLWRLKPEFQRVKGKEFLV